MKKCSLFLFSVSLMLNVFMYAVHPSGVWYAAMALKARQSQADLGVELSPQTSLRPDQYGMYTVDLQKLQPMPTQVPILPQRSFLEQLFSCFQK